MAIDRVIQQVEALEADSNYEAAFALCTNALQKDVNNKDLIEKTAMVAKIVGNTDKCIECWERLLKLDPQNQLAYFELQDMYLETNKYKYYSMRAKYRITEQKLEAAIDDLKKAISNTTDENEIIENRFLIANLYSTIGKDEKAEDQYLLILDMGHNTAASILLANYYVKLGNKEDAIDVLNRAYENDKESIELKKFLGELYMRVGNHEMAKEFVTDDYSNIKLLLQQGKNEEAKTILDKYSGKKDAQYYLLLAEYYYNTESYDECFGAIDDFAKQSPRHPLIFQMRALCFEKKQNEAKAKYNWGWYNLMKGQNDIALAEFIESNNIERNADTLTQIIKLYDAQRDKTTAAEFVEQLVELEPHNTLALKRLGEFYQSVGDYDKSYEYYKRILDYDENNLSVLINAAKVAEKIGFEAEAMTYYEKIVKYTSNEKEKANAQKRLRILNGEEEENLLSKFLDLIKKF